MAKIQFDNVDSILSCFQDLDDPRSHINRLRVFGDLLDTDFSLTENFDRWKDADVEFVFGIDAMPNLVEIAQDLDQSAWKPMKRRRDQATKPVQPRAKRPNYKERIVVANKYLNKRLVSESIAEFDYQPGKCDYQPGKCGRTYRVVVLHKEVHVSRGQLRLFEK